MKIRFILSVTFLLLVSAVVSHYLNQRTAKNALIEWGWDTPFLQDMPQYLARIQELPFDGAVLDVRPDFDAGGYGLSWYLFSTQPLDEAFLTQLENDFANMEWGRFNQNFLRITVHPADVDWFEDWTTTLHNLETWAGFAQALGFQGVMFDTEQYDQVSLFDFVARPNAASVNLTDYAAQARLRGAEVMQALERGYPGLTVILTYGIVRSPTWQPDEYELLLPFVEGMQSARHSATLIDGYENSYIFKHAYEFQQARQQIEATGLGVGFGLWIDPVCGDGGLPETGCGFTPDEFRTALKSAFANTDRYIWIYSEHINWYTGAGIPAEWWAVMNEFAQQKRR
jgi:hypothetical protein